MAIKTPAQLLTQANQIREETKLRANSATRVGGMLVDIIDTLYVPAVDASATGATNTAAIQAAINAAHTAGGGKVQIPAGVFSLDTAGSNVCLSLASKSNIWLCGSGVGATQLYQVSGADSHMINIDGTASNLVISDMTLNGNRAGQTLAVHGVRCVAVDGLWLDRLFVTEAAHYGIGLQGALKRYVFLSNIKTHNTGGDGIDVKNTTSTCRQMAMSNVHTSEHGLSYPTTNEQVGIDLRGVWQVSNVSAVWSTVDGFGIRFREGIVSDPGGVGADHSSLTNFYVEGPGATSVSPGMYVAADDVHVSQGYIKSCYRGVQVYGARAKLHSVTVDGSLNADFRTETTGEKATFTDCESNSGVIGFRLHGPDPTLTAPRIHAATTTAIDIQTTALRAMVTSPRVVGAGGADNGIVSTAADTIVSGGDVSNCARGLQMSGARPKLLGVTARANLDDGIRLSAGADDATVRDCYVTGNTDEGLDILSDRVRVMGGEYTSNGGDGIQITSGADGTMVDGVYFSGNTGSALDDGGTNTRVGLLNVGAPSPFMLNFPRFLSATGAPSQVAPIGSTYLRLDGTTTGIASGVFVSYVKEFGSGVATGWVGK